MNTIPHPEVLRALLHRRADAHKYDFGHVLIIGGSPGMVGAPLLAAEAALRIGAGLVTIASDSATVDKLERRIKEVMTLRLPEDPAQVSAALETFIADRHVSAVVAGPGLRDAGFVPQLLARLDVPVVLDAAAFTVFRDKLPVLKKAAARLPIIATPHAGEYATLLGETPTDITASAAKFAQRMQLTLVVKMPRGIVFHQHGHRFENTTGNPGMATAGSGDVLTGVIAGLVVQGVAVATAADLGVYVHGLAGDLATSELTQPGMLASDITSHIPIALRITGQHLDASP